MHGKKALYLSDRLYKKALATVPIVCVDVVVKTPRGVLLGVRNREPAKGVTWLIGGRMLFGEKPEQSVTRKVREETGLKVRVERFIGPYSLVFTKSGVRHTLALLFVAKQTGGRLRLTKEYSSFLLAKRMPGGLRPYVKRALEDSGVFGGGSHRRAAGVPSFLNP